MISATSGFRQGFIAMANTAIHGKLRWLRLNPIQRVPENNGYPSDWLNERLHERKCFLRKLMSTQLDCLWFLQPDEFIVQHQPAWANWKRSLTLSCDKLHPIHADLACAAELPNLPHLKPFLMMESHKCLRDTAKPKQTYFLQYPPIMFFQSRRAWRYTHAY